MDTSLTELLDAHHAGDDRRFVLAALGDAPDILGASDFARSVEPMSVQDLDPLTQINEVPTVLTGLRLYIS